MKQQEIDFSVRGQQLRLRDALRFETGLGSQPVSLKAVFVALDSFAGSDWCFASHESIAQRANVSERTVRRAIEVLLERLVLIRKQERRGPSGNKQCRYAIVWSNVSAYIEDLAAVENDAGSGWIEYDQLAMPTAEPDRATAKTQGGNGQCDRWPTVSQSRPNGQSSGGQRSASPDPTDNRAGGNGHRDRVTIKNHNLPTTTHSGGGSLEGLEGLEDGRTDRDAVFDLLTDRDQEREPEHRISSAVARQLAAVVDLDEVRQVFAEFYHPANRGLYDGPGAIVERLRSGHWFKAETKTTDQLAAADAARQAAANQAAEIAARQRQAIANASQQVDALERQHGPILDAMTDDQRLQLAESVLDPFNLERYCSGRQKSFRVELLEAIADQVAAA